jgi:uncharacterized protein
LTPIIVYLVSLTDFRIFPKLKLNKLKYIVLLILVARFGNSQNLYYPKSSYKDFETLKKTIPELAKTVIKFYKDDDSSVYYNNLFRYQLAAKEFDSTIRTIKAYRRYEFNLDSLNAKGIASQFELFALTQLRCKSGSSSFNKLFPNLLKERINNLNERALFELFEYFKQDTIKIISNFYKLINSLDKANDSINIEIARKICWWFNSYNVYAQILPIGKPFIDTLSINQLIVEDSVLIKTRDGKMLSATITRRKHQPNKLPCIMILNIYANKFFDKRKTIEAVCNGYVGVTVNTRGKYLSTDSIIPFEFDGKDAYDAIDWISKQEWCNGSVGMYGGSYLGFTQWAAAKMLHPALKTIVPQAPLIPGIGNTYSGVLIFPSDISRIHFFTDSRFTLNDDFYLDNSWKNLYVKYYSLGIPFNRLDSLNGETNALFQKWIEHPSYDSYWQDMVPYKSDFTKINIPVLSITGHFDGNRKATFYYFHEHYKYNKKANHYIIFGPYDHFEVQNVTNGRKEMDEVARMNIAQLVWDWFDYVFKNKPRPELLKDKINYQVMGANIWKHKSNMKSVSNDSLTFYLSNQILSNQYTLTESLNAKKGYLSQSVDFKDRSDSLARRVVEDFTDSLIGENNSLIYISNTLTKSIEISGEFSLQLNTIINKKDMDLEVNLLELMPDGRYFSLSEATARVSYLKDKSKRNLIKPNTLIKLPKIIGRFTAKKINAGSKLVLAVTVLKNSSVQINYGTGKDVSTESIKDAGEPLQIKWYNDSYIKIPVWRPALSKVEGDKK